ncbi:MAG: glycosyltransferase [Chitinophagales bacterium]
MIYLMLAFAIVYALLCVFIFLGWKTLAPDWVRKSFVPQTKVSIVIAFRNEAENLPALLKDISAQKYPEKLFEIILVDDHSQDNGSELIKSVETNNIRLLSLNDDESGKKVALQKGIQTSDAELIVTTDADCRLPELWLRTIINKFEKDNAKLIAGPVVFERNLKVFQLFQSLDFIGLQVLTGGSFALGKPVMCNGANLAFERKAYLEHSLQKQKNGLASGDDVFTLFALQEKFPDKVFFLKNANAIVSTVSAKDFSSFWQQRLRWASKSAKFGKWWITAIMALVFFFNLILLGTLIWGIFDYAVLKVFLLGFTIKFLSDALILNSGCSFFGRKTLMRFSPIFQIPHMLYTVCVGAASQFSKYRWKGRKY